ncbi:FxsA family protein [Corynebacterium caspium]|uniref:FxsA family protein n=1 Tax=Corynebacterium caspium TaxID=234828 RepID=UPI000376BC8D|nr:FxsA family protein [Corynebacterium caspium]WKD59311.1 phage T7 F exclusion suppressor FxsA [Corynebacterium caspium DSM 44850]
MNRPFLAIYFVAEVLTIIVLSNSFGFGRTLLLFFGASILGMFLAVLEFRHCVLALRRRPKDLNILGNIGLTAVGGFLLALPGILTTIFGLLLIFAPTRALIRMLLAQQLSDKIARFGVRSAVRADVYRRQAANNSFNPRAAAEIIPEEEIARWAENLAPEDFENPDEQNRKND